MINEAIYTTILRELNTILDTNLFTSKVELSYEANKHLTAVSGMDYVNSNLISNMVNTIMKSQLTSDLEIFDSGNTCSYTKKLYIFTPEQFKEILDRLNKFYMLQKR